MRPKSKESADQAVGYLRVLLAVGVDSAEWEAGRLVTIYQRQKFCHYALCRLLLEILLLLVVLQHTISNLLLNYVDSDSL